ncbi:MAG: hypothetical protein AABW79_02800 [Nanoarchaeota archaeon]
MDLVDLYTSSKYIQDVLISAERYPDAITEEQISSEDAERTKSEMKRDFSFFNLNWKTLEKFLEELDLELIEESYEVRSKNGEPIRILHEGRIYKTPKEIKNYLETLGK